MACRRKANFPAGRKMTPGRFISNLKSLKSSMAGKTAIHPTIIIKLPARPGAALGNCKRLGGRIKTAKQLKNFQSHDFSAATPWGPRGQSIYLPNFRLSSIYFSQQKLRNQGVAERRQHTPPHHLSVPSVKSVVNSKPSSSLAISPFKIHHSPFYSPLDFPLINS